MRLNLFMPRWLAEIIMPAAVKDLQERSALTGRASRQVKKSWLGGIIRFESVIDVDRERDR